MRFYVVFPPYSSDKCSMGATCRLLCQAIDDAGYESILCSTIPASGFNANISIPKRLRTGVARLDALLLYIKVLKDFRRAGQGGSVIVNVSQEFILPARLSQSVVIVHDTIQSSTPRSLGMKILIKSSWALCRWTRKNISVSKTTQRALKGLGVESDVVYLNSFDAKRLGDIRCMGLSKNWDAVWCGTLARHKRIDLFYGLAESNPDCKFAVIVPGFQAEQAREAAPDNVEVLSDLGDVEYLETFAQSSVFVSTSEIEGFGRPAMEAYLTGAKLLLSDIPIYREVYSSVASFFSIGPHSLDCEFRKRLTTDVSAEYPSVHFRNCQGQVSEFIRILEDCFS